MRMLVESLKRLYANGLNGKKPALTKKQIAERVIKGSISTEEYEEIVGEPYPAKTKS